MAPGTSILATLVTGTFIGSFDFGELKAKQFLTALAVLFLRLQVFQFPLSGLVAGETSGQRLAGGLGLAV